MGHKWYEALISGHNGYLLITSAGKQGRYYFLFIIPVIIMNIPVFLGVENVKTLGIYSSIGTIILLAIYIDITLSLMKRFKKWMGFAIGTIILPFIFYPILAFGKATYSLLHKTK